MLLCNATFKAIKHMAPELGGATQNGVHVDRLKRPTWGWLWRWAQRTHTDRIRIRIQITPSTFSRAFQYCELMPQVPRS